MTNILLIKPHIKDLGAFKVRRLLPAVNPRSVGPFVFWDHFGPVTLPPGENMDVRPHPHIGLATVTWLFEGAITHRDSLGFEQDIRPGDVNWMTAGAGIVHSERTPEDQRGQENPLHGLQIWLGLPESHEQVAPEFYHYAANTIPHIQIDGVHLDLIAGEALGQRSPVKVYSPLCYLAAELAPGQSFSWPRQYTEQAVYVVRGQITIDGENVDEHHMAILPGAEAALIQSKKGARVAILAGEPIGPRFLWWNFVSSSKQRIQDAAMLWQQGGFDRVPGDDEFIPLDKLPDY